MTYMVQAMINIPENVNHILNIVKARYNLKTKSEAIAKVIEEYGSEILEPELRPEFVEKLNRLDKEKGISFKNIEELRKIIEE
jgi:hypothetical protein